VHIATLRLHGKPGLLRTHTGAHSNGLLRSPVRNSSACSSQLQQRANINTPHLHNSSACSSQLQQRAESHTAHQCTTAAPAPQNCNREQKSTPLTCTTAAPAPPVSRTAPLEGCGVRTSTRHRGLCSDCVYVCVLLRVFACFSGMRIVLLV